MRKASRIKPFMNEIAEVWEQNCPDWTFTQLIMNVLNPQNTRIWDWEEDKTEEHFKRYFGMIEDEPVKQSPIQQQVQQIQEAIEEVVEENPVKIKTKKPFDPNKKVKVKEPKVSISEIQKQMIEKMKEES